MDHRQLEYFLAIVDHGGMTSAAVAMHVAQPSLSQAIRNLERELNEPLFHRAGRGVVLTAAGEALIGPARQAVRSVLEARTVVESVRELRAGRLDLSVPLALAIEPVVPWIGYIRRFRPALHVRLEEVSDSSDVIDAVRGGGSELGFVTAPVPLMDLKYEPLFDQYWALVRPHGTPDADTDTVPLAEVSSIPLIVDGRRTAAWTRTEQFLYERGVGYSIAVEVTHPSATLQLLINGAGAALMPLRIALRAKVLGAVVQLTEPAIVQQIGVVYRAGALSAAASAFLDLVRRDANEWTAALDECIANGTSRVAAAQALDQVIWKARRRDMDHQAV